MYCASDCNATEVIGEGYSNIQSETNALNPAQDHSTAFFRLSLDTVDNFIDCTLFCDASLTVPLRVSGRPRQILFGGRSICQ
jgi:hypothetical protein